MADPLAYRLAYRIDEAAKIIGVSRTTLYKLIAEGKLKTIRIGSDRRVPAMELERLSKKGAT
jgi:excisionase family DNA binding protein